MFREMGREALKALKARKVLRVEVVKGVGEMGKMAKDSLRCPITTLQVSCSMEHCPIRSG
jgi:hypothetical protein